MLATPKCWKRDCKHYIGVKQDKGKDGEYDEGTERNVCKYFPDGIPDEIAYGKRKCPSEEKNDQISESTV